jgi:hypothetical protein
MIKLNLAHRSTTEIVVISFTLLICIVMIIVTTGTIIAKIWRPDMEVARASEAINNMLSTIIGALVGFISGRAIGRREAQNDQTNSGSKT